MLFRLKKLATTLAYLLLGWVTWEWFQGDMGWGFSLGCVLLSGLWLGLTSFELRPLFNTYFTFFSRLRILIPISIGLSLAGLATWFAQDPELKIVAAVELVGWLVIYLLMRRNRQHFIKQGRGRLPAGAWINPPAEVIEEGDLILTGGNMARRLHESLGHGELVVRMADGKLYCLTSYMEKGAVLTRMEAITRALQKNWYYVVLRLNTKLTADQKAAIPPLANIMVQQNKRYRVLTQAYRTRFIQGLPLLPKGAKRWLINKFKVTGYDWIGLFTGKLSTDRWTCIGLCLEFLHRLGVETKHYGTGLLGLGTGMLDPIMPVRFLADPAFKLLTVDDQAALQAAASEKA